MSTTTLETDTISELLREGMGAGHLPFLTVSSGSMAPLLRIGDEVGVQIVRAHQLNPGDLVVVSEGDFILTHRFIGHYRSRTGHTIVTRGDRSRTDDPPWTERQLMGRVVARRRKGRLLWLDFGAGRRLNRFLARLSKVEHHLQRRLLTTGPPSASRLTERLVRLVSRLLSETSTALVERTR